MNTIKNNTKVPGPIAAGFFFSLTTIMLIYIAPLIPVKSGYLKSGLGEILLVLLPAVLFLIFGKYDIVQTLKLKGTKPVHFILVMGMMITAIPIVTVMSALVLLLTKLAFNKTLPLNQIQIPDVATLMIALAVIGVSAAVCEEVLFRGLITKGYEKLGTARCIALTSILFGMLHRDFQKALATTVLGVVIAIIVHRTKSIYAGMLAHFVNNASIVLIVFYTKNLTQNVTPISVSTQSTPALDFSSLPTPVLIFVIVFYAFLLIGFVSIFTGLMYAFIRSTREQKVSIPSGMLDIQTQMLEAQLGEQGEHLSKQDEHSQKQEEYSQNLDVDSHKLDTQKDIPNNINAQKKPSNLWAWIAPLPGVVLILLTFTKQVLYLLDIKAGVLYELISLLKL